MATKKVEKNCKSCSFFKECTIPGRCHFCAKRLKAVHQGDETFLYCPDWESKEKAEEKKKHVKEVAQQYTEEQIEEKRKDVSLLVLEQKRVLSHEIVKTARKLNKLISQWSILFPDERMASEWYQKNIGQYDILNEMEV